MSMYTKPINRYRQFHLPNQTVSLAKVEKDPKYSQPGYDWLTRIEREGTEGSCVVVRSSTEALGGHYTTFVFGVDARGDRWRDGYFGGWTEGRLVRVRERDYVY